MADPFKVWILAAIIVGAAVWVTIAVAGTIP